MVFQSADLRQPARPVDRWHAGRDITGIATRWQTVIAVFALTTMTAMADVPRMVNYQGRIAGAGSTEANLLITLYDADAGGNVLFSESHFGVPLSDGVFAIQIGAPSGGIPDAALDAQAIWLGLSVDGGPELTPRVPVVAAPYALKSNVAEALVAPDSFLRALQIDAIGNVGVGTAAPQSLLDVAGNAESDTFLVRNPNDQNASVQMSWLNDTPRLRIGGTGVGAGNGLDIQGPGDVSLLRVTGAGVVQPRGQVLMRDPAGATSNLQIDLTGGYGIFRDDIGAGGDNTRAWFNGPDWGEMVFGPRAGAEYLGNLRFRSEAVSFETPAGGATNLKLAGGNVGIGASTPAEKLDVFGSTVGAGTTATRIQHSSLQAPSGSATAELRLVGIRTFIGSTSTATASLRASNSASGIRELTIDAQETGMGISLQTESVERAHVDGVGLTVTGRTTTDILEITGGSDLSESFDIHAPDQTNVGPGMVVCIDPARPGHLVVSNAAYDTRVAGIVSGAGGVRTGMIMGQGGTLADGKHAVALTGRVYCWCDASQGAIQPGDLLTTAQTPGHAMRVDDANRSRGAIIGKAMTSLDEGRGLVLVLVSLQ